MDRQKIFDNFVGALNGIGRCIQPNRPTGPTPSCIYVKEGHPGCAIGCQPGFREKFGEKDWVVANTGMFSILDTWVEDVAPEDPDGIEVSEFFGVENYLDVDFLQALQDFHDDRYNWDDRDSNLLPINLSAFCAGWGLKIPQESS